MLFKLPYPMLILLLIASCEQRTARMEVEELISSANNVSEELILEVDPNYYDGRSRMVMRGDPGAPATSPVDLPEHVIHTGEYRFAVDDLDTARTAIQQMVRKHDGYVQGEELNRWQDRTALVMRVRIPADRFEKSINSLLQLGDLEYQMVQATDVSMEWTDVAARLQAKRTLEERYLDLVARSNKVSELLEVERELGKVRSDIESMEARSRSLSDQVGMSTLTITCVGPVIGGVGATANAIAAIQRGGEYFVWFLIALLQFWPFILIIPIALIGLRINRKLQERRQKVKLSEA